MGTHHSISFLAAHCISSILLRLQTWTTYVLGRRNDLRLDQLCLLSAKVDGVDIR